MLSLGLAWLGLFEGWGASGATDPGAPRGL